MSLKSIQELVRVLELLKIEKQEDLVQYQQKILYAPLEEKKKKGLSWYPVKILKSFIGTGEQLVLEVERTTDLDLPHVFQSGKVVSVFANTADKDARHQNVSGVIRYVKGETMSISLNADDLPEWIDEGKLGVDLLFDEASYREMEAALHQVMDLTKGRSYALREILLGYKEASFNEIAHFEVPDLNSSQNEALGNVLAARDLAIIHGPPGTGKTTTIVHAIKQVIKREKQVLVCAPSNAAVDLLSEKLSAQGVNVLRLGHPARVTEANLSNTLDAMIADHEYFKDLRGIRRKAEEMRTIGLKYKRNFGHAERHQRKLVLAESRKMLQEADLLEKYIVHDLMEKAQVVASTLVGASHNLLKGRVFKTVFIDEAGQALEPACWIPILKAEKVVFAGDHFQLPPTVKSLEAAKGGLSQTLFEKSINRNKADKMLKTQYRMNQTIMGFSAQQFYQNQLLAHESVKHHLLFDQDQPMEFIDTAGCGFSEQVEQESRSSFNKEEANLLIGHLKGLIHTLGLSKIVEEDFKIGVISPYKAQVAYLEESLSAEEFYPQLASQITINTIDAFQGQERDIIYISLVRSNDIGEIGFLADIRRMNVAMTRARKKLVMVGDSATLASHKFYDQLLDYVHAVNAYRSAYELM
jgi:ATP-dependent RNA/DNA helicase IGHMBP2